MDLIEIEHLLPGTIDAQTRSTEGPHAKEAVRRARSCTVKRACLVRTHSQPLLGPESIDQFDVAYVSGPEVPFRHGV